MYSEIPILSFFSAALSVVPLAWYLQARNIAAVAIGTWLFVTNLIYAVDALVWVENADAKALVWCDVSTSFITGSRIAIPGACFSICIHLERLASFCQTSTPRTKRRRIVFECLMCFGLPLVYIALHLVVQPRRFDLFYGFGCRPATYPTITAIFLVMIPPLLLTIATIVCIGIVWRHFLVYGIQFSRKQGSFSSLTCSLYLRLVGMTLLEAGFSAALTSVVMWNVLSPGLASVGNMSRDLSEVLVWDPEAITNTVRTALKIEWSVTVIQSVVYFGLFACRMEVVREGWELTCSFLRWLRMPIPSLLLGRGASERSLTSISAPTLPMTEVDLSLAIESASTLTPYDQSMDKSFPFMPSLSGPPSTLEDGQGDIVMSAIDPAMIPPESPSRASAIASSHNSLESNFDPTQLHPEAWPRTPTWIPARFPRRSLGVGCALQELEEGWVDVDLNMNVLFPTAKVAVHAKSITTDYFGVHAVRVPTAVEGTR